MNLCSAWHSPSTVFMMAESPVSMWEPRRTHQRIEQDLKRLRHADPGPLLRSTGDPAFQVSLARMGWTQG